MDQVKVRVDKVTMVDLGIELIKNHQTRVDMERSKGEKDSFLKEVKAG
jgi:hypothetical protein